MKCILRVLEQRKQDKVCCSVPLSGENKNKVRSSVLERRKRDKVCSNVSLSLDNLIVSTKVLSQWRKQESGLEGVL